MSTQNMSQVFLHVPKSSYQDQPLPSHVLPYQFGAHSEHFSPAQPSTQIRLPFCAHCVLGWDMTQWVSQLVPYQSSSHNSQSVVMFLLPDRETALDLVELHYNFVLFQYMSIVNTVPALKKHSQVS